MDGLPVGITRKHEVNFYYDTFYNAVNQLLH